MPDGPRGEYRRRRRTVRWLVALTAVVVSVDIGAVLLSLWSSNRANHSNSSLSEFIAYAASGLLLLVLIALIREYTVTEHARRSSREAQLIAERLSTDRSLFLSRVSHELRNPLGAILGFGQLLEREQLPASQRETLEQMMTGARHLTAIVGDLLDLSSFEAGELRLTLGPVPLTDAITEARSLIWPSAVTATVGIRLTPGIDDLYVKADHNRLQQVLLNLLSNAVKYNRRGGNVVVNATREGERVRIEVADTGIGIPSEAIGRLAQPFERLDAARNGIPGTGLGLAVARGLVEAMGGSLGLSSQEGVGTTVWFDLPAAVGEEPARGLAAPDLAPPLLPPPLLPPPVRPAPVLPARRAAPTIGPPPTIASPPTDGSHPERISVLYIEDNRPLARLVEKIFALAPELRLQTAGDAALGLAMARELAPDLIMLDLHLPDMSGEQVLAALRVDPRTAAIPVLIVTAEASPLQAKELDAAGAQGYITKPFDVDELLTSVRAHAGARAGPGNHDQPVVRGVGQSRSSSANVSEIGPERAESR